MNRNQIMSDIEQPPETCVIIIDASGLETQLFKVLEKLLMEASQWFNCNDPSPDGEE